MANAEDYTASREWSHSQPGLRAATQAGHAIPQAAATAQRLRGARAVDARQEGPPAQWPVVRQKPGIAARRPSGGWKGRPKPKVRMIPTSLGGRDPHGGRPAAGRRVKWQKGPMSYHLFLPLSPRGDETRSPTGVTAPHNKILSRPASSRIGLEELKTKKAGAKWFGPARPGPCERTGLNGVARTAIDIAGGVGRRPPPSRPSF